jgi:colanic acid biosynthesis glycosyl transferase WcaI
MRVLLVAQYFWPESVGAGLWLHQLATDLTRRGHSVTMVTGFPNYPEGRLFEGYAGRRFMREWVDGVEVIRTWIYATPDQSFGARLLNFGSFCASAPLGIAAARRPEVIYCVLPPLALGLSTEFVAWCKRVPVLINIQDIYPDIAVSLGYLRNRLAIAFFQRMERLIYRRAAAVTVITDSFRENLLGKGVRPEKIHVVPNWADAEQIQPGAKDNRFRQQLGVDSKFLVVYSGGMGHNSCLEAVVEAARILADDPYEFVLIGDGAKRAKLERRAAELALRNIHFLPFQTAEVYAQVLAASDVQLLTLNESSTHVSLPSKMLKIMASGRPMVALANRGSDAARLVLTAKCGDVVSPGDAPALARTLREFAANREGLRAMGQNARRFLVENFSRERCVAQVESLLLRAAHGGRNDTSF